MERVVRSLRLTVLFLLAALGCRPAAPAPFPAELTQFTAMTDAPLFAGEPGKWDANIRERGWIVIDDGGAGPLWKLYYTGYETKEGIRRLGLATSKDGLAWTRHPGPLVDNEWIEDVCIVKDGEQYVLVAEGKDDRAHSFTSKDGLAWTREGELDVRQKNGDPISPGPFGTPTLFRENGTWYLFYERNDKAVWLASSPDRKVWTHVQDDPVMTPGPGEYDHDMIALNQIVKRGQRLLRTLPRLQERRRQIETPLVHRPGPQPRSRPLGQVSRQPTRAVGRQSLERHGGAGRIGLSAVHDASGGVGRIGMRRRSESLACRVELRTRPDEIAEES